VRSQRRSDCFFARAAGYAEADRKPSAVMRRGNADARGGNMKPRIGWPTRDRACCGTGDCARLPNGEAGSIALNDNDLAQITDALLFAFVLCWHCMGDVRMTVKVK
jgi:hypothetical protein